MGFAAAEPGLGLDDGVAALAVDPPQGGYQQVADAAGDVGAAEKLQRVAVHRRGGAVENRLEVGDEIGFQECAVGYIPLGAHGIAPGLELLAAPRRGRRRRGGRRIRRRWLRRTGVADPR